MESETTTYFEVLTWFCLFLLHNIYESTTAIEDWLEINISIKRFSVCGLYVLASIPRWISIDSQYRCRIEQNRNFEIEWPTTIAVSVEHICWDTRVVGCIIGCWSCESSLVTADDFAAVFWDTYLDNVLFSSVSSITVTQCKLQPAALRRATCQKCCGFSSATITIGV